MKRVALFVALFSLLTAIIFAQNGPSFMPQQRGGSSPGRGTIIIDPDDYRYCTGFMLNTMFLSSGDFYLDIRGYLGLSADQVSEIRGIRLDFIRGTADLRGELATAQIELEDMLSDTSADSDELGRKIEDVFELEGEYQAARIAALIDAREVLTNEQRVMAEAWREGRQQNVVPSNSSDNDQPDTPNSRR